MARFDDLSVTKPTFCDIPQFNFNKIFAFDSDVMYISDEEEFEDFIYEFMNDDYPKVDKPFEAYFEYTLKPEDEGHDGKFFSGVYKIIPVTFCLGCGSKEYGYEVEKVRDSLI